jgi:hypothetical protein
LRCGARWFRLAAGVSELADPFAVQAEFRADQAGDAADDPVHEFVELEVG